MAYIKYYRSNHVITCANGQKASWGMAITLPTFTQTIFYKRDSTHKKYSNVANLFALTYLLVKALRTAELGQHLIENDFIASIII